MKKALIFLTTLIVAACFWIVPSVFADNSSSAIKIDGQFDDWSGITKDTFGYYYTGNWAMVNNNTEIDVYLDNGDNGSINLSLSNYTLKIGNQTYNLFMSQNGTDLTVSAQDENDNWKTITDVGVGKLIKSGNEQKMEFNVSLAKLNQSTPVTSTITLSNSNLGSQTVTAINSSTISNSSSASSASSSNTTTSSSSFVSDNSSSQSTQANSSSTASSSDSVTNTNTSGNFKIVIDGQFNDWSGITKSNMVSGNDNDNIKKAALIADDQNIYFYIAMEPVLEGGYTQLQPSGYTLTVGGISYSLDFNHNSSVSLNDGETKMISLGIYDSKTGSYVTLNGQAAVTKEKITQSLGDGSTIEGWADVVECAVPFSDLKGVSNTSGQIITLENTNLWTGKLETSGGTTHPVVLAGLGLGTALFGLWKLKKRKYNFSRGSK
ncbi:Firmicu-CTERM sorting domain-containing protein [Liquorilactobacillus vini]|nr:Firmicu-CTERM sorting domain-containing protein [Liquorilactobacillus vini]